MVKILHLGVVDLSYSDNSPPKKLPKARKGKQSPRGKKTPNETTGDVAEILERKYHVIETFYDLHEEEIGEDFAEAASEALTNVFLGGPPGDPLAEATSKLQSRFKTYLETEEIADTGTPGVPTKAALRGISHRFKGKRGPRRPSFIDTGLYESSFIAWVDE